MIETTEHPYIIKNSEILNGEPIIKGSRIPVRAIAEYWHMGDSPDRILEYYPHLSMAKIFDALSYYWDHKDEINYYIELNRTSLTPKLQRSYQEVIAEIRERQKIRGHRPSTQEEVDNYLRDERESWGE